MQDRMSQLATALLGSLDPDARKVVTAAFDAPDHFEWTYLPGPRPGLTLGEMSLEQRDIVFQLIELVCSEQGLTDARGVLFNEVIHRGLPQEQPGSTIDLGEHQEYYVRVLGDPTGDGPWAWRINGHHLAIHATVGAAGVAITPQFFGSNPVVVQSGPHQGRRFLEPEESLARSLLAALEPGQRELAVVSDEAPRDILTRHDPIADTSRLHQGLPYGELSADQRQLFTLLVGQYVGRAAVPIALRSWQDITDAGLERLTFAWAGPLEPGHGHYYSVAGPTVLLEYDNTQNSANHIHSVWRDLRNDWGKDLLAAHYGATFHPGSSGIGFHT